jgi:hypothetical protein
MPNRNWNLGLNAVVLSSLLGFGAGVSVGLAPEENPFLTPEGLVTELYRSVSFEAGSTPDWARVRSMFLDEAVIVLRTSREETTVFSVDGFVDDFVAFIERANADEAGFAERVLRIQPLVFGDIAHVLVLYEASLRSSEKPPQRGVDSFQLIRKDGRWWIVAVTNELPTADRPVPPVLED